MSLIPVNKLSFQFQPKKLCYITNNLKQSMKYYSVKNVLGIETSCDDTGCALVNSNRKILGESLYSQHLIHLRYGGINPIVAKDLHRDNIDRAVLEALGDTFDHNSLDAIAVTVKPGLLVSLQIGVKYANYLAKKIHKPIIPIHHMEAHALAARMYHDIPFPFLVLLISGGHCLLAVVKDVDEFFLLGESLDNPPGEVLDKISRRMKLRNIPQCSKMSGGRAIEYLASKSKNPKLFQFPLPLANKRDCDFSFSGLKDSLFRKLIEKELEHDVKGDGLIPEVCDLCAGIQLAVAEHIVHRTHRAALYCLKNNLLTPDRHNLVVSGGVACNDFIFNSLKEFGSDLGFEVYRPPPRICTDNGVMIAWNGIEKLEKRKSEDFFNRIESHQIEPKYPLGKSLVNAVKGADLKVKVKRLHHLYK